MGDWAFHLRRRIRATARNLRELRLTAYGAVHTDHPIMAHIIPIRRCNLACEYCNEYDDFSKPVPVDVMISAKGAGVTVTAVTLKASALPLPPLRGASYAMALTASFFPWIEGKIFCTPTVAATVTAQRLNAAKGEIGFIR